MSTITEGFEGLKYTEAFPPKTHHAYPAEAVNQLLAYTRELEAQRLVLSDALRKSNWLHIAPQCGLKVDHDELFGMIEAHKKILADYPQAPSLPGSPT